MPAIDVLILVVARQPGGLMIAGMTTERDPRTGLRWVRTAPFDPLGPDELRYADGELIRPGDVVRLELGPTRSEPPYVENVALDLQSEPLHRIRQLVGERRAAFFRDHLDPAPGEVLKKDATRSLCLVKPDYVQAIMWCEEETGEFDARLALAIGNLRPKSDIVVHDIYWQALMREWLAEDEFAEVDYGELQTRLGDIYLVLGIDHAGKRRVLGVHTVPPYEVTVDEDAI